jgi:hypothetical protein
VSISAAYSEASREVMAEFLLTRRFRRDLAAFVEPRHPFRSHATHESEVQLLARTFREIEELNGPIRDIESGSGVPVLLRHYVKLAGQVAAFNIHRKFSNAVDALLLVDLRTPPKAPRQVRGTGTGRRVSVSRFAAPAGLIWRGTFRGCELRGSPAAEIGGFPPNAAAMLEQEGSHQIPRTKIRQLRRFHLRPQLRISRAEPRLAHRVRQTFECTVVCGAKHRQFRSLTCTGRHTYKTGEIPQR